MGNRVQTLLQRHGNDFFSRIGKLGFQATTDLYFNGDRQAHLNWLKRKGWYSIDKDLPYHKPAIYGDPGEQPARLRGEDT